MHTQHQNQADQANNTTTEPKTNHTTTQRKNYPPYKSKQGQQPAIQAKQRPVAARYMPVSTKHTPVQRETQQPLDKDNVVEGDMVSAKEQGQSQNAYYYYTSNGKFLGKSINKNKGRAEVRIAIKYTTKGDHWFIEKSSFVYKDHTEFDNAAALIYGESFDNPEWFTLTAHAIVNTQELRAHARDTKGLPDSIKNSIDTSLTDIANDAMGGTGHANIKAYKKVNKWADAPLGKKQQARLALIQALTRGSSKIGDGGLLDGNWHPKDPTKGATGWHGSVGSIGTSNQGGYKTKKGFEDHWNSNYKQYGVAAFEPTVFKYNENNIGAVYHKRSDEWLGKLQKRAGGSRAYQEAIKRGQGTFPHP
jgi:hypothetical protein